MVDKKFERKIKKSMKQADAGKVTNVDEIIDETKEKLAKEELRKSVRTELCEALKYIGRAANLLRHAQMPDRSREALDTADALAQILASTSEYINDLLAK